MPHDLFGPVAAGAVATPSARSRKSTVVVVSVATHAVAIFVLGAMQLDHVDQWPTPREVLAFYDEPRLKPPVDIELPPARPRATTTDSPRPVPAGTSNPTPLAPVTPPADVTQDRSAVAPTTEPSGPGISGDNVARGPADTFALVGTPVPAPAPQTAIRLHSGIRAPEKIVHVAPLYPALARLTHKQGVVIIEATIDARGNVASTRVLRSIPLLDQAALDAVTQWKFSPTLLNGVAVPIIMTVTVNFELGP